MKNPLAIKINTWSLFKFTFPTIITMIFMSAYSIVDGVFVSRFVGTNALSAVNIVYPFFSVMLSVAIMLATGGSAVCGYQMGQGEGRRAKESFTFIVIIGLAAGLLIGALGAVFTKEIVLALGADNDTLADCIDYARMFAWFVPFGILQALFQYFLVTAGRPKLGFAVILLGGIANMVLDYVFIVPLQMGIAGAALATGIGFAVPSIIGILYFTLSKKAPLRFVKPAADWRMLGKACANGMSEMIINLAAAVTTLLFNIIMMRIAGVDGVAAITIVLYTQFLTTALYMGYSSGTAPLISYNHGNGNTKNIKKLFRHSIIFISVSSVIVCVLALFIARPIVGIFAHQESAVYNMAVQGYKIFVISVLFAGVNIFASAMFTAFSDGKTSAVISVLRTFVFLIGAIIILPLIMGINGVWMAVPAAELITAIVSVVFFIVKKKKYHY